MFFTIMTFRNSEFDITQKNSLSVAICKENVGDLFEFIIQLILHSKHIIITRLVKVPSRVRCKHDINIF